MIEAYCTEEVVECCQDYLVDNKGIGLVVSIQLQRIRKACAKIVEFGLTPSMM